MNKIVLITGASSGIGKSCLVQLVSEGHIVYGGARKQSDLAIIKSLGAVPVVIEMTDNKSLKRAVSKVMNEQSRVDVLINNAGYGLYGAVEDVSIDDARKQFEVNMFGLARITQLVLPHMRKQKSGTIINISSMGGKIYTPLGAWYHATKHALEGWSDCLRLELKQFDIDVVIIEPGAIQTTWGAIAISNLDKISGKGAYKNFAKQVTKRTLGNYKKLGTMSSPDVVARTVSKAINAKNPKTRYATGKYAKISIFVRKFFGDKIFDKLIMPKP